MSVPTPRNAATVILMRPAQSSSPLGAAPFEVFMVQRHSRSKFMANAHVYPGGVVDAADSGAPMLAQTAGRSPEACAAMLGGACTPAEAVAFFVAAARESFEEAGVLLASPSPADSHLPEFPALDEGVVRWRAQLNEGRDFAEILREGALSCRLDALRPFAHWITPEVESRRYDTRFFVAVCPASQYGSLIHDNGETVDSLWTTPEEALGAYARGEMQLAPPTLCTLEELARLGSIEGVMERCESEPIPAIMPVFVEGVTQEDTNPKKGTKKEAKKGAKSMTLLFPGDPEYPGDASAVPLPKDAATRVVLSEGRWWAKSKGTRCVQKHSVDGSSALPEGAE